MKLLWGPALGILVLICGCVSTGSQPVSAWAVADGRELTFDAPPLVETEIYSASAGGIRLLAAANETIGMQLALRANGSTGPLDVVVTDLTGGLGRITAGQISRYRCLSTRVERFGAWFASYGGGALPRDVFDALVPWETPRYGGPIRLERGRTEAVWLDIAVPPGTPAGEYAGQLRVTDSAGKAAFECRLAVEVVAVELPGTPSLPLVCRVDPRELLTAHLGWSVRSPEELRILPDEPSHRAARELLNATISLFQEHRSTPVLWGCFPKFVPTGPREMEIEWAPYDELVSGWPDGSAFSNGVGVQTWLVPASLDYPSAALNGGFETARYARVLGAYLAACNEHFDERGWRSRAVMRLAVPGDGGAAEVQRMQRLAGIVTQSEVPFPLLAHLPLRSLRAFGWEGAPNVEIPGVGIWCPPADWLEPQAASSAQALGDRVWLMPGSPPFSPSLSPESGDTELLGWLARRYGLQGIWIEHAADTGPGGTPPLVYPGKQFGLADRPVATIRLKRLRRAAQDHALLVLLEARGAALLADRAARSVVRRALLDACNENLLSWRTGGWTSDSFAVNVARRVLLRELGGGGSAAAEWSRVTQMRGSVDAACRGVRLTFTDRGLTGRALLEVTNELDRGISGEWEFPEPPTGWLPAGDLSVQAPAGGRGLTSVAFDIGGLGYNAAGVAEFPVVLNTRDTGEVPTTARVAVAACPTVETPPVIDGDLRDWSGAANNIAGDFRLVRWPRARSGATDRPTSPTQAYFCADAQNVYFGVWCSLSGGERPIWQSDNEIPIDGAIPWGQDLVEILLRPDGQVEGTGGDVFCLQIKPSGLLIAREGCRTDPPMNPSREWRCGAKVAVQVSREAWAVELALPIASLPEGAQDETIWGCNVSRLDARRGEYSSWSGAQGHCYSPQRLGNLVMLKP